MNTKKINKIQRKIKDVIIDIINDNKKIHDDGYLGFNIILDGSGTPSSLEIRVGRNRGDIMVPWCNNYVWLFWNVIKSLEKRGIDFDRCIDVNGVDDYLVCEFTIKYLIKKWNK